ncbi:MAG: flagellar type III secretion system pore protein FliP [Planctomycetes bacterium]|nr:flagellar type III secretion system pore protein FliP [Planctomycetota bacterium]
MKPPSVANNATAFEATAAGGPSAGRGRAAANRAAANRANPARVPAARPTLRWVTLAVFTGTLLVAGGTVCAQPPASATGVVDSLLNGGPDAWTSPGGLSSTLQVLLLLTVLSLAPAILLMTTSFVRIVVVLGLLRQALGTQQLPPNQVITSLAIFMTLLIMAPVGKDVYDQAIAPYSNPRSHMTLEEAWQAGSLPIKRFMSRQIDAAGNAEDIHLFYRYLPPDTPAPKTFDDVPLQVLLPAYMLSELKVAFLIGFQIYLPFLILDIVVASVTISMGMLMLPPVMISLPFKLMLFVLVDGWHLVVGMLLESFGPIY